MDKRPKSQKLLGRLSLFKNGVLHCTFILSENIRVTSTPLSFQKIATLCRARLSFRKTSAQANEIIFVRLRYFKSPHKKD